MTARPPTPSWLLEPEAGLCPCGCIGSRRRAGFVEQTIGGGANLLRGAMFTDDVAASGGLLQRVDPKAKLVGLLGLLLATAFVRHVPALLVIYSSTLALAVSSRIGVVSFARRVWTFVPLFTGVIVLPAACNLVTPGTIAVPLGTWFGTEVGLTSQGLTSVGLIVLRVATSVSLVVLLTVTTPWPRLLAALRALHVPRMFVLVAGMAHRYLFLLLGSVVDMYTARKARTVVDRRDMAGGRRFVAASAGALFGKAHALSEEVHQAMVARGYRGDARTVAAGRMGRRDGFLGLAAIAAAVGTVGLDRVLGG